MTETTNPHAATALFVDLIRLADGLRGEVASFLKREGLSDSQYNVLRILRGGPAEGLACSEVSARLITRVPDVTRLVDRLEAAGLVERQRSPADRRVVRLRLSPRGREICERYIDPLQTMHERQFASLPPEDQEALSRILKALLEQP